MLLFSNEERISQYMFKGVVVVTTDENLRIKTHLMCFKDNFLAVQSLISVVALNFVIHSAASGWKTKKTRHSRVEKKIPSEVWALTGHLFR